MGVWKRLSFEEHVEDVELLITGSSNAFYGIDANVFPIKAYNLANLGSGMFYDESLLKEYLPRLSKLKNVVLTANYFTMGTAEETYGWRHYFYRNYFNTPVHPNDSLGGALKFIIEPKNYSRLALFGNEEFLGRMRNNFTRPMDVIADYSGWYNNGFVGPNKKSLALGKAGALAHNVVTNTSNYKTNLRYWEKIIPSLQRKGISVSIAILPTHREYHMFLDKEKVALLHKALEDFSARNLVTLHDYTKDPRFDAKDYSGSMIDHMNARGARKMSRILSEDILSTIRD